MGNLVHLLMSFSELGVAAPLARSLAHSGFTQPFPIQTATLPDAIKGRDVLGRGQTGSGKTLAFSLALLTRLAGKTAKRHFPLALVLSPTRELAMQINDTIAPLARKVNLSSVVIAGGMPMNRQIQALERAVPILVATPGRLIDLMHRGAVDLSRCEIVVLDEADQMADMGFMPSVREILDATPSSGQRLLFSATLDRDVDALVKKYLRNPIEHSVETPIEDQGQVEHDVFIVKSEDRDALTSRIAAREGGTIMFVRTQRGADRLAEKLARRGIAVGSLHGGKAQGARNRALEAFRSGSVPVLVATNVAARGIHVDDISLVVHVDAPTDPKDYLHRAGRTARAGESGIVVTLARPNEQREMRNLAKRVGVNAEFATVGAQDAHLDRVTGAREPSGEPWVAPTSHAQVKSHGRGGHSARGGHASHRGPRHGKGRASRGGSPRATSSKGPRRGR